MLDGRFIRGTTPIHSFTLPFKTSVLKQVTITYVQRNEVLVKKTLEDCSCDGNTISIILTQHETLRFEPGKIAKVQIKAVIEDRVLGSDIYNFMVEEILDSEVFEDEEAD